MPEKIGNNKRVLKNTVFLYVRMLITVFVSLYTSRVVLQYLGVVDFGILNVVGGVVSMFSFITSTMTNASTRFFSYALGKGDKEDLAATFKTTMSIYVLLIVIILVIAETIGLWFVWNKLNIPPERHSAAMLVYQISLMIFCCGMLRIPYNSSIIAHERMSFYAYTSIIEVSLKLAIVFMLMVAPFDKLVFYNFMFFLVSLGITFWYVFFCRKFEECKFGFNRDKEKFKSIFSFAGWNFTSNMGDVAIDQGINVLINIFFGPAINAARGIAFQIKGQVASFCTNFQIAAGPQITKYYAAGDLDNMNRLVLQSSKISFYLMFLVSVPTFVGMEMVLQLWLKEVPDYALILTRLVLVNIVVNSLGGTMNIAIQASGKIKKYVLALTAGKFFTFAVALVAFKFFEGSPEYSVYCTILYACISIFIQCVNYRLVSNNSILLYLREVLGKAIVVAFLSIALVYVLYARIYDAANYLSILLLIVYSFVVSTIVCCCFGFNKDERQKVLTIILGKLKK
ncbi:hypothetical protein B7990_03130 [Fibrobacter sp. UWB4]|uniref:lipopolysaccharide biosynthesis protein n=1 Tax=Fibrobacter sp. UWB4 TaxID=1964356 RepID=UPI000B521471|nr:hypothetical protein [Fibrobacter sp. UWB4]OWV20181.1 hypothetical protein B7990_03130 [Fibrobacter sp. UWB4]